MTRRRFLYSCLATGGTIIIGRASAVPGASVSVADFGVRADGSDSTPGVQKAIKTVPKEGGTLSFPPGRYLFSSGKEALNFLNFTNLTVEGNGAELIFRGAIKPANFYRIHSLVVRNLTIDWERPSFSQGEIVAIASDRLSADLRVDDALPVAGGEKVESLASYERSDKLPAHNGFEISGQVRETQLVGPQILRMIFGKPATQIKPGMTIVLRHQIYGLDAMSFTECGDVAVTDLTIHTSPGMGIRFYRCNDVTLERFNVTPRQDFLMSTAADAMHFRSCGGALKLNDCTIQGMGDDGLNVHGDYFRLTKRIDSRTGEFVRWPPKGVSAEAMPALGSEIIFLSGRDLGILGNMRLDRASPGLTMTATFDHDMPAALQPGDLFFDSSFKSRLSVSNCRFLGNRARGILAHDNVVVENCTFQGQSMSAILLAPDTHWMEGPAVTDVVLRGNHFQDTNRSNRGDGVIWIDALLENGLKTVTAPGQVNRNVEIAGNDISTSNKPLITARSISGLQIVNNRFEDKNGAGLQLNGVKIVVIAQNSASSETIVTADPESGNEINLQDNKGIKLRTRGLSPGQRPSESP